MKGPLAQMMKQAQEMQRKLEEAQQQLADMEATGESGGGMVKVVMNGAHAARAVSIDGSLLGDREMLEDLLTAAISDAARRVESMREEHMRGLTAGLNLPAGMKLPF